MSSENKEGGESGRDLLTSSSVMGCGMDQDEKECLIHKLPDEVMMMIMAQLDLATLIDVVPKVCNRWRHVCSERFVWRNIKLSFGDPRRRSYATPPPEEQIQTFIGQVHAVPFLPSLDLRGAPTPLKNLDPAVGLQMPHTPLITERGLRVDRDFELKDLAVSCYQTDLPSLLRHNAATLQSLTLEDLYEVPPMYEWPVDTANWEGMLEQLAAVMQAIVELPRLHTLSLIFCGRYVHAIEDLQRRGDMLVLATIAKMRALRTLHMSCATLYFIDNVVPDQRMTPGSMQLTELTICTESHIRDELLADLVEASCRTLETLELSYVGPKTSRALSHCCKLERCALPSFDYLQSLDGAKLRFLRFLHNEEKLFIPEQLESSSVLERIEELELFEPKSPEILSRLVKRCKSVKKFWLIEHDPCYSIFHHPMKRLGPAENPVVLLKLIEGAMPNLQEFLCIKWSTHFEDGWKDPLKELKKRRPLLKIL